MSDKHVGGMALLNLEQKPRKIRGFGELDEETAGHPSAGSLTAQGTTETQGTPTAQSMTGTQGSGAAQGTETAGGGLYTQGSDPAQGSENAPGRISTHGRKAARGRLPAHSRKAALGGQSAHTAGQTRGVAPTRDFMRVPNSVIRSALSKGVFRGKSKDIYDYLYSKTRGAVAPRLSVQLTRGEIMSGASIGSTHTLRDNLQHLRDLGLVTWDEKPGEQGGNLYSVHIPEEANLPFDRDLNPLQVSSPDHPDQSGQKLPRPPGAETDLRAQGSTANGSTSSGGSNTFIKDIPKTDDEALAGLVARLKKVAEDLTGKGTHAGERGRWDEVAEVIETELRIAAGRTTVSSVPAFLAEHLRRRLFKKDRGQLASEDIASPVVDKLSSKVDASKCPDCFGTGMWYPEGYDKGVAKCRHEKLTDVSQTQ